MKRMFAIGDIHGCSKTFRKLLFEEIGILRTDEIYCIGDYIDRGPDSKGVIDLILFLQQQGYNLYTLRGNHEQMLLDVYNNESHLKRWLINGADATLKSFGIKSLKQLDKLYVDFFNNTRYYYETPAYIFVHAGLNFNNDNIFEDTEAMLWIREEVIDKKKLNGKIVIHGHTPKPYDYIISQIQQPGLAAIDIDGGCVYKYRPGMGNLFALSLPDLKLIRVENID